jgi:YVTN family beta-propeller protein
MPEVSISWGGSGANNLFEGNWKMKHRSTSSRPHGRTRSLAIISVQLFVFFGLSGGMNPAQGQTLAYVTNHCEPSVEVVDIATSSVVATIPVDPFFFDIEITPNGTRVYLATAGTQTVTAIDTATNTVTDIIPLGFTGPQLAISPDGARVYAGGFIRDSQGNTLFHVVSAIDTATNTVIATLSVNRGPEGGISDLAVTPDGSRVYVVDNMIVSAIDTATHMVIATIPVGDFPADLAITPDGTRVYVTSYGGTTVSVIDTTTNTVTATVPVDRFPNDIGITPDGARAYVTHDDGAISVIDTATNTVTDVIPIDPTFLIEIAPDGERAYVLIGIGIVGIDTATNAVVAGINGPSCPGSFALTSDSLIPTTREHCKDDGYRRFGPPAGPFRNQGQCVSYVEKQSMGRR